jgi:hypothetical protein
MTHVFNIPIDRLGRRAQAKQNGDRKSQTVKSDSRPKFDPESGDAYVLPTQWGTRNLIFDDDRRKVDPLAKLQ